MVGQRRQRRTEQREEWPGFCFQQQKVRQIHVKNGLTHVCVTWCHEKMIFRRVLGLNLPSSWWWCWLLVVTEIPANGTGKKGEKVTKEHDALVTESRRQVKSREKVIWLLYKWWTRLESKVSPNFLLMEGRAWCSRNDDEEEEEREGRKWGGGGVIIACLFHDSDGQIVGMQSRTVKIRLSEWVNEKTAW